MADDIRIALLIDAENISAQYAGDIIEEIEKYGICSYKRIYGNWERIVKTRWEQEIRKHSLKPMMQVNNTRGKNASDSALIIDTMDLLYQSSLDAFCIVSSDSDFTRLASRLRESQKYVLGMGESKTPRSFISACNKFLYLDVLFEEAENEPNHITDDTATPLEKDKGSRINVPFTDDYLALDKTLGKDLSTIKLALVKLTEENSDEDGWIFSGTLGNLLNKQFSDFDVRNFGYKKFVPFIESLDLFDVYTTTDDKNTAIKHNYFRVKTDRKGHKYKGSLKKSK